MRQDEDASLLRIAETVADGMAVDWEGLMAEEPSLAPDLAILRYVEGIMAFHCSAVTLPNESSS